MSPLEELAKTETTGWRADPRTRPDTIARLEKVLELLAVHAFVEAACRQAGCSKKTFYQFKERYQDFAEEAQQAMERAIMELEATGWACARKAMTDPRYQTTLIFALKSKAAWRETRRLEHGGRLTFADLIALSMKTSDEAAGE